VTITDVGRHRSKYALSGRCVSPVLQADPITKELGLPTSWSITPIIFADVDKVVARVAADFNVVLALPKGVEPRRVCVARACARWSIPADSTAQVSFLPGKGDRVSPLVPVRIAAAGYLLSVSFDASPAALIRLGHVRYADLHLDGRGVESGRP